MNTHNNDFDFSVNDSDINTQTITTMEDKNSNTHSSHTTGLNVQPQIPADTAVHFSADQRNSP